MIKVGGVSDVSRGPKSIIHEDEEEAKRAYVSDVEVGESDATSRSVETTRVAKCIILVIIGVHKI